MNYNLKFDTLPSSITSVHFDLYLNGSSDVNNVPVVAADLLKAADPYKAAFSKPKLSVKPQLKKKKQRVSKKKSFRTTQRCRKSPRNLKKTEQNCGCCSCYC